MNLQQRARALEAAPASALLREALNEARQLATTELEIAKRELRKQIREGVVGGIAIGAAVSMGTIGIAMCFVALAMAVTSWVLALCIGGAFLLLAAGAASFGYGKVPKRPFPVMRRDLGKDLSGTFERIP